MSYEDDILRPPEDLIATGDPNLDGDMNEGDDDPMITDDGYGVITPKFDEADMLDALENPASSDSASALSPQQAYEEMKYMAPLSKAEKYILDTSPFLDDTLSWIDDPGHEDEMFEYQGEKSKAMDNILDDQMYGESEEDQLVRTGSDGFDDSGFGLRSLGRFAKKVGKGAYHAAGTAINPIAMTKWSLKKTKAVATMLANMAAWPIKRAIRPTINKTAMNIARKNGRAKPTRDDFKLANQSVIHTLLNYPLYDPRGSLFRMAGEVLKQLGTGVSGMSGAQKLAVVEMGIAPAIAVMAAAIAAALTTSVVALVKASSAHAGAGGPPADASMDPNADPNAMDPNAMDPNAMDPNADPNADASAPPPDAYPGDAMPYDQSGKLYTSIVDPLADMNGNGLPYALVVGGPHGVGRSLVVGDSLGGVATQIFGEERRSADEIAVDGKKAKRKADLAKLTKAANAGDAQASMLVKMFAQAEEAKERAVSSKDFQDEQDVKVATLAERAKSGNKKAQAAVNGIIQAKKDNRAATVLGIDPFLYKLNPGYWIKNARQRRFIDDQKKSEQEGANQQKYLKKRQEDLDYGEKAAAAKQKAEDITKQNDIAEARLKELEGSLSGDDSMGAFVGAAIQKMQRNTKLASYFAQKITSGQGLSPDEVETFKKLLTSHAKLHKFAKKVTGVDVTGYHDRPSPKSDLVGETAVEILGSKIGENRAEILGSVAANAVAAKGGKKAPPKIDKATWTKMAALGATDPKKLNALAAQSGIVMSPQQKKYLKSMVKVTKQQLGKTMMRGGVPISAIKNDFLGSWGGFVKAVGRTTWAATTLPFKAAAYSYHTIKNAAFPGGPPGPPGQQSIAQANQRRLAALQRRQVAAQQLQAAQAQYDAQQQAAQAEADAQAQEQATAQAQQDAQAEQYATPDYDPSADADSSGAAVSKTEAKIIGAFVGDWVNKIGDDKVKAVVVKASEKSATGAKIRAGARVYSAAKKGDPKAKKAIKNVSAKAKTGSPQAKADYHAIKAGKIAVDARVAAKKKGHLVARHGMAKVRRPNKFAAGQRKVENKLGDKLAQMSRAHQLHKASRVEARAAHGHKPSQRVIARTVKRAKGGDKKARSQVAALQLARHVRKKAPTKAEQKRVMQATKVVQGSWKGKKVDLQQIAVVNSAAKAGQPNAKRAIDRLKTGALIATAIATGAVLIPKKKSKKAATLAKQQDYNRLKGKVAAGTASQEEAFAASKKARELGLPKEASALALKGGQLKSQTADLKKTASVAAAAQGNNPEAKAAVNTVLEKAGQGDPAAINSAGKLAAIQAIDTVNKGGTMSPEMGEATALVARAHAGDPEAKKTIANVGEAVQKNPTPEAVQAAIALTAAGAVAAALAAKPAAQKQWSDKAAEARGESYKGEDAKQASTELNEIQAKVKAGTASESDAARGKRLAVALNKPAVAAQISALMPPSDDLTSFTSLPDAPLPPIMSWKDLMKESAKALLLATRDPLQNYREGVTSRGKTQLLTNPAAKG